MMTPNPRNREPLSALETHYTVQDLAGRWKLSPNTIRKLFAQEPDVLSINLGTGQRVKLSIPESAVARVRERISNDAFQAAHPRRRPLSVVSLRSLNVGVAQKPRYFFKRNATNQRADGKG